MHILKLFPCIFFLLTLTHSENSHSRRNRRRGDTIVRRTYNQEPYYWSYRPYSQQYKEIKKAERVYRLPDIPNHLWLHQYPRQKFIDGHHAHTYYTNDYIQKLHGYSKPWLPQPYYRTFVEPWHPTKEVEHYVVGEQRNPMGDQNWVLLSDSDERMTTTTHHPNKWHSTVSTVPPQLKFIFKLPFNEMDSEESEELLSEEIQHR